MTDRLDPPLAALERRLDRASPAAARTGLRRRVLAAVDDVLGAKATPATSGREREPLARSVRAMETLGAFAAALAVAVAVVTFAAASMRHLGVPLTLEERGRIAGVNDPAVWALLAGSRSTTPALRPLHRDEIPAQSNALRVLAGRRLLEETL